MDFRDLRYFEVIAAEGNLGRAAERLFRTQPALTKCIDRLEADLGAQLFEKSGRHMRLTAAGTALLARAKRLAIMVEDTSRELQEHASGLRGTIRVGCVPTLAEHLMPAVLQDLLAEAPEVKLDLMVAMNDPILRALREGQLDLVVGPVVDNDEELESEQFAEDVVVVMASGEHPIFAGEYTLRDLQAYKWILPATGVASRQFLDQTFERNGLPRPQVQVESNVLNMILPILEKTPLLGFMTRFNLLSGRANVREVALLETTMRRRLGLTFRRTGYISPVMQRLSAILRARGGDLSGDGEGEA